MTVLNLTIKVVTFHHRGCCMLGVFLLLAFTCLGHECQDLLSLCDGSMCAQTRPRFILSSERVLGEWGQNPCLLQVENPLYQKILPRGGSNLRHCIKQDSEPNTLPMSYSALPPPPHPLFFQVTTGTSATRESPTH